MIAMTTSSSISVKPFFPVRSAECGVRKIEMCFIDSFWAGGRGAVSAAVSRCDNPKAEQQMRLTVPRLAPDIPADGECLPCPTAACDRGEDYLAKWLTSVCS